MFNTKRALTEFAESCGKPIQEASKALERAKQDYMDNPEDGPAKSRYSNMSAPAGYPDVHSAAVAFQSALHATAKEGHVRGWQGGEEQLEALQQAAQTHGLDSGLFVTPDGAGNKREHILQLTRLYGGKFLPGDGRSGMWDPKAHSFPDADSAQRFSDTANHYYPSLGAAVQEQQVQGQDTGADGQPIPTQGQTWTVDFAHRSLGRPYPPGSKDHAQSMARRRSGSSPHQHHVVTDQTGEHSVSLDPDPATQEVVATYHGGKSIGAQAPATPPEEAPAEAPAEAPPEAGGAGDADGAVEDIQLTPEQKRWQKAHEIFSVYQNTKRQAESSRGRKGQQPWHAHPDIKALFKKQERKKLHSMSRRDLKRRAGIQTEATRIQMSRELDEIMSLYQNSVRKAPALMMEGTPVDSNRGVTSRGSSHYDRFASPATREKVLKSRMDEIEAFARSRSLPLSNVYAVAEASMRTGKVPDLGQYGLAGDDAVATKQFVVSNVLNIQGLEDIENEGDSIEETMAAGTLDPGGHLLSTLKKHDHDYDHPKVRRAVKYAARSENVGRLGAGTHKVLRNAMTAMTGRQVAADMKRGKQWQQTADVDHDDSSIDETHGTSGRHAAVAGTLGQPPQVASQEFEALRFMKDGKKKKKKAKVDESSGQGLRKAAQVATGDYGAPRGGRAGSGRISKAQMKVGRAKVRRAGRKAGETGMADYSTQKRMSEEGGPHRTGGAPEASSVSPGRFNPGPNAPPDTTGYERMDLLPKAVMSKLKSQVGDSIHGYGREDLFRLARDRGLLGTEESVEKTADRILGIEKGDPRSETWPKLDSELARLLQPSTGKSLGGASLGEAAEIRLVEHDYREAAAHYGGKYLGYVQPHQAKFEFPNHESAQKFANVFAAKTTATPHVRGKVVSIDEPMLGESHLGTSPPGPTRSPGIHNADVPTKAPLSKKERAKRIKLEVDDLDGASRFMAKTAEQAAGACKEPVKQAEVNVASRSPRQEGRSQADICLGIEDGDPRGENWPKMSEEMRRLLNMESQRFLAPKPGIRVEFEEPEILESTSTGMVGGFIGGGLSLNRRAPSIPPYDASINLEGDRAEKEKKIRSLLKDLGLR